MITSLKLHQIGPAPNLDAEFGERLNLVTGDNGLGKTFLLDACWYALTQTWADCREFHPTTDARKGDPPSITFGSRGKTGKTTIGTSAFSFESQKWKGTKKGRPTMPGLVIYARIDGGFSLWDPARNYWLDKADEENPEPAYQFNKTEVWDGLTTRSARTETIISNGLVRDVENWRLKKNKSFETLQRVLERISAGQAEAMSIGESERVGQSAMDVPTLKMPYGKIPVTLAASGMKRVLSLAYLLVWAWQEHCIASEKRKNEPTRRMVLLFDEVEAHLHPKWQRVFLPAVHEAVRSLLMKDCVDSIQIIATTHSPLVMGSVEDLWEDEIDRLFDFDLEDGKVEFECIDFAKHGAAENWLDSDSFNYLSSYPVAAKQAIDHANQLMASYPVPQEAPLQEVSGVHDKLLKTLGGDDEYWPLWIPYYDQRKTAL